MEVVSRGNTRPPPSDTDDVDMTTPPEEETSEEEPVIEKPKTTRKPRKVVPVGKNGLKKRRIIKSRTTMDDKGFVGSSYTFPP